MCFFGLGQQDEVLRAVVAGQQEVALVEQLDVGTRPAEHLAVERGDVAARVASSSAPGGNVSSMWLNRCGMRVLLAGSTDGRE